MFRRISKSAETGQVFMPVGKVIAGRWLILNKLGEGGCGSVYRVEDLTTNRKYALKAESNFITGGTILKLEVQILRQLNGRKHFLRLIHSGKRVSYSYMVMDLCGASLSRLFNECRKEFSASTQIRIGIQILYGLKQLHEIGYIHRDVKPGNFAVGRKGTDRRIIHLLDFGLAREFILRNGGRTFMRKPRSETLFRGTARYCSIQVHNRMEQSRPDDLWSMVYMLAEFRASLPWAHQQDKRKIAQIKANTLDTRLFIRSASEFLLITKHLRSLTYFTRPDYLYIFDILHQAMIKYSIRFSDPYDWEHDQQQSSSVSEESSGGSPPTEEADESMPFTSEDFAKNELGF